MKTAISLPDTVFKEAEKFAHHARKSRSKLYTEAICEYLARHSPDEITDNLNRVIAKVSGNDRAFINQAAKRAFSQVEW